MSKQRPIPPKKFGDILARRLAIVCFAWANGTKATARCFGMTPKTVRKWASRYRQLGAMGLLDQSKAPVRQAHKIPPNLEQRVIALRREHPAFGARRLKREFGLPLSHGSIDGILRENNLIQPHKTQPSQKEEDARMASLLERFSSVACPDDMEGDFLSNPFSAPGLARELKAAMLKNGQQDCEQLDVRVREVVRGMRCCALVERFRTRINAHQDSKETPQEAGPSGPASSLSDVFDAVGAIEVQESPSAEPPQESRPCWNGPEDPRFQAYLEVVRKRGRYLSQLAELFGVRPACEEFSDDQLSTIIAETVQCMGNGRESRILAIVRDSVTDYFLAHGMPLRQHYRRVVEFWSNLFSAGLVDELDRRTKQKESRHGSEIAELIVEEDRRGPLLSKMGKKVARLRSFKGERPKPSEDAESQACADILDQLGPLVTCGPPAANPDFLKATITGALNDVQFHARDRLWDQRKFERGEGKVLIAPDEKYAESDLEGPHGIDSLLPPGEPLHRHEKRLETKILVDQAIGHLEEEEKKVIMLVKLGGYTQKKVARELEISQPTVSRLLDSALEKLRKHLS